MKGKYRKRYASGSMELANWQQFKALLREDNRESKGLVSERLADTVDALREQAALVESDKQNEYAARLWKGLAEDSRRRVRGYATSLEYMAKQYPESADLLLSIAKDLRSMV